MLIICGFLALLVVAGRAIPFPPSFEELTENDIPRVDIDYRLPTTVIPSHYDLTLEPIFSDFTFQGDAIIDIKVSVQVNEIKIHTQNLTVDEVSSQLLGADGVFTENSFKATYFPETDFYSMSFEKPVIPGDYKLKFKYTGILHNDLYGFYRSSYVNELGEKVWLATTQFEPTFARRAFPCFDEPALKATFKIKIRHADNYLAISNMHSVSQRRPNNDLLRWETEFATTPAMSTYLIAFVVSDFKYLSNQKGDFRIYSRSNQIKYGNYANEVGPKELEKLVEFTNKAYGITKMDNFAIPQFAAGAMENWGLVTYRESALLYHENVSSLSSKQNIASIMSHEFAHQWFGNWVSPLWWDYTWLNEGFANYFQFYITDKVETTWRFMDRFVVENLQRTAFKTDDNEKIHAMDTTVKSPSQIRSNFDSITYSKAGSVIRMFSHVITEPNFQAGLREYLTTNEKKAVASDALINSLVAATPKIGIYKDVDLKLFFESWVKQPGFPLVTVIRNYTTGEASITQKRYLTNQTKPPTELWIIPVNYVSEDNPDFLKTAPTLWIPNKNTTTVIKSLPANKWVIFNKQQNGYYRVNYDDENWNLIAEYMKRSQEQMEKVHVLNRAQLLDDSFQLAEAGELPNLSIFLRMTEHLKNDTDSITWYVARNSLLKIKKNLANSEYFRLFKLYMLSLMEKLEKSLGYEESSEDGGNILKNLHRPSVVSWTCEMGSKGCLKSAHEQLLEHLQSTRNISVDLRGAVLCGGMRSANETTWKKVYDLAALDNKQTTLITALGCSSNKEIIKNYLDSTLLIESPFDNESVIKAVVSGNSFGADLALDFIKDNMKKITEQDSSLKQLEMMVYYIAEAMTTAAQVDKLNKWIETLTADEYKDFVANLKKTVVPVANKNVNWITKHELIIAEFLKNQDLTDVDEDKSSKGDFASISLPSIPLLTSTVLALAWRHL